MAAARPASAKLNDFVMRFPLARAKKASWDAKARHSLRQSAHIIQIYLKRNAIEGNIDMEGWMRIAAAHVARE